MKLLFDLGNTRAKWALWDGARLDAVGALAHTEAIDFAAVLAHLPTLDEIGPDEIWVASVASPALDAALAAAVTARWQRVPQFVRSSAQACGVRNAYAEPARLGVDRWLSLIALHAQAPQAAHVSASCGTALTLDALGPHGVHLGGLIAPSPELMRQALLGNTARLGVLSDTDVVEIADNTATAVTSGSWLAGAALIERFLAQAAARLGATPTLVLSGGGAERLGRLVAAPHRIEADLVLRGLAHYADRAGGVG